MVEAFDKEHDDTQLVFQARIMRSLRVWRCRRVQMDSLDHVRHRRLVNETLQRLDQCHSDFEERENLATHRLVLMTYFSARCFVNFLWIKAVPVGYNDRLQKKVKETTLDEAIEILEHVSEWTPKGDVGSLPTWHLSVSPEIKKRNLFLRQLVVFAASVLRDLGKAETGDLALSRKGNEPCGPS